MSSGLADQEAILDHAVALQVGAIGDQRRQFRAQLVGQQAGPAAARAVTQAGHALGVEAVPPIAQGLPVHAAQARGVCAAVAVQHGGDRQQARGHAPVLPQSGLPAQLANRDILPYRYRWHRYSLAE